MNAGFNSNQTMPATKRQRCFAASCTNINFWLKKPLVEQYFSFHYTFIPGEFFQYLSNPLPWRLTAALILQINDRIFRTIQPLTAHPNLCFPKKREKEETACIEKAPPVMNESDTEQHPKRSR
ncbi:MAG TPA: hypothetical protein VHK69_20510 [Chitinophagaceae bacterium]|nr:hypothetical protein [Chitinophagaceae bacterium]